jgi:hypothetical protein
MMERADKLWRMVKAAAYLLFVLVASVAFVPDAFAHGLEDSRAAPVSASEQASISQVVRDTDGGSASSHAAADRHDPAGCGTSCPSGDCGAGCPSCCGGTTGCASCCGAMALPGDLIQLFTPTAALRSATISVSVGVGTIPSDPPPRTSL